MNINYLLIAAASYLIGSIPFALLYIKLLLNKDIRSFGSKNTGALNALRIASHEKGRAWGVISFLIVFFFDAFKGAIAVILATNLMPENTILSITIATFFAILGHNYSIILNFKGGRGAATLGGILLYLNWQVFLGSVITILCFMILAEALAGRRISKKFFKKAVSDQIIGRLIGEAYAVWWIYLFDQTLFYPALFGTMLVIFSHKDRLTDQIKEIKNKAYLNG
ncbi:MAG: glycerol-3-phosphate acyltransferase [Candidatus Paceibacterota bacterium]|jgi:acyl-phosphate glycerol 3-phosphate acyltransferase